MFGYIFTTPISFIIGGDKVHDKHIVLHRVQAIQPDLKSNLRCCPPSDDTHHAINQHVSLPASPHLICRKHAPPSLGDDHLGAQLVELLPQRFHLKLHLQIRNSGIEKEYFRATMTKASMKGYITCLLYTSPSPRD